MGDRRIWKWVTRLRAAHLFWVNRAAGVLLVGFAAVSLVEVF